jgi:hypothetical protein
MRMVAVQVLLHQPQGCGLILITVSAVRYDVVIRGSYNRQVAASYLMACRVEPIVA